MPSMKIIDLAGAFRKSINTGLTKNLDLNNSFKPAEMVLCPVCGESYCQQTGSIMYYMTDEYKAWEGRGNLITISFDGECGHSWNLCIGYHKGQSFTFIEITRRT